MVWKSICTVMNWENNGADIKANARKSDLY